MKLLFLTLISLIILGCDQPVNQIKESNLHKHIKILASDEFEGRGPGSQGGEKTKLYLKSEFQNSRPFFCFFLLLAARERALGTAGRTAQQCTQLRC